MSLNISMKKATKRTPAAEKGKVIENDSQEVIANDSREQQSLNAIENHSQQQMMTVPKQAPNKGSSDFAKDSNKALQEVIDNAMQVDAKDKRLTKLSEQEYDWALEQLAAGNSMRNVCSHLGVSRSALLVRASYDPDFDRLLRLSMEIGAHNMVETALDAVWGGESSTGSIERDKLVAQFTQWYAARRSRKDYGDRALIDAQSISITLKQSDSDW